MKTYNEPTMSYQYGNDEKEFIFCMKGRPFPCLVSPYLPTPTASLIDYNLVRDLGLKMTDLQCQKFSFSGFKMRILGKISLTAQCIHDGISSGAFHIKANVILDLAKNLDTDDQDGRPAEWQQFPNKSALYSRSLSPCCCFSAHTAAALQQPPLSSVTALTARLHDAAARRQSW